MRNYFFTSPIWLRWIYSDFTWAINTREKVLFLTFDDGPDPVATEFVLNQLDTYAAKATFFCTGENISKNPELFSRIIKNGHAFGNHTFRHLNGWRTSDYIYLEDIWKFERELQKFDLKTKLFRPPYGRIKRSQFRRLPPDYRTIMWTHLAGDFDKKLQLERAKKALLKGNPGSIFLFHDSFAAFNNMKQLLPYVLEHYTRAGFTFKSLTRYATD